MIHWLQQTGLTSLLTVLFLTLSSAPVSAQTESSGGPAATSDAVPDGWQAKLYGFVELDAVHDSTQSFNEASLNAFIFPRGTYLGDNGRTQFTAKNSRIGLALAAPSYQGMTATGVINFDFFGTQSFDVTENDFSVVGTMRMRHAYLRLKTPVVDLIAGQHPTLFGWGGAGFYPGTVAFLGVVGQIYHHDAQMRLTRTFGGDAASVETALAAVRPAQRDAELPDIEAGVRLAFNRRRGRTIQGNDRPETVPLSIGVSGLSRQFSVAEYRELPRRARKATGWGVAIHALLPVLAARDADDYYNCLTLTGEFSMGAGIADRYSFLTGGARFQALPNPAGRNPPPLYRPNIDNGLVTFDADENLKTIDWRAFVVGAQYYLPVRLVRIWLTAMYSNLSSDNIANLTPSPNHGDIFTRAQYADGSLFVGLTPQVHFGLSLQLSRQARAAGPFTENIRGHFATNYFF